jgi:hypothetical protein
LGAEHRIVHANRIDRIKRFLLGSSFVAWSKINPAKHVLY